MLIRAQKAMKMLPGSWTGDLRYPRMCDIGFGKCFRRLGGIMGFR